MLKYIKLLLYYMHKIIRLEEEIHTRLKMFVAMNRLRRLDEGILKLLEDKDK
jgi:hypothetical protein